MALSKTRTSVKWQIHTQWVSPHTLLDKRLWKTLWKSFLVSDDFIRLHYLNQASAAKYWPNFSFRSNQISPELKRRNLDQTLCLKSEQKFSFMTKLQLPNLNQHDSQYQEKQQYKQPQQVLSWQRLITLKSTLDVSLDVRTGF